uniref:GDP-fucose pyrophosphorylase domain-containing protein n=1 Tax=Triticum urartu TaxID=4572 RepID=A0A8R7QUJ1_TRIUA
MATKHVLLLHVGSDSKRVPWANPMGKAFLPVPYLAGDNPDGPVPLLFDHIRGGPSQGDHSRPASASPTCSPASPATSSASSPSPPSGGSSSPPAPSRSTTRSSRPRFGTSPVFLFPSVRQQLWRPWMGLSQKHHFAFFY